MKDSGHKKVIYTVITGQYDCLFPPLAQQPGWDLLCFTDDPGLKSDFWSVRPLPPLAELEATAGDPVRQARLVKILAHRFLAAYDYSVYIDANRVLLEPLDHFVTEGAEALLCLEGAANDPCAAGEALLDARPDDDPCLVEDPAVPAAAEADLLRAQIARWRAAGLPRGCGCPATALLGRRHNEAAVAAVMEAWAREVLEGSAWDELALPFACFSVQAEEGEEFSPPWTERLGPFARPNHLLSPAEETAVRMPHRARLDSGRDWAPRVYPPNQPPPGGPYEDYPLLLTIGVPVSNQIGTIRRCLEGIEPLLRHLPAELVVVDTGSTDGTVGVCREFGARVLDFPWCDDMSAARNVAIRAALGLWYMSIDDDEWFEDIEPLLDFFRSGRWVDYDYAAYSQRNYSNPSMKRWEDFPTPRIAKMHPSLHFHGRIHDVLEKDLPERRICYIDAAAHHLGFAHVDAWSLRRKTARNIWGLRLDMAQYPDDLRFSYQMCREMSFIRNYPQALRLIYWTLALDRADPAESGAGWRHMIIAQAPILLVNGSWFHQAILFAERWLSIPDFNPLSQCTLLRTILLTRARLGDYKGSNAHGLQYLVVRRELLRLPESDVKPMLAELMINSIEAKPYCEILQQMIINYRLLRDYTAADTLVMNEDMLDLLCEDSVYRETTLAYLYRNRRWATWQLLFAHYYRAGRADGTRLLLAALAELVQAEDYEQVLRLILAGGVKAAGFMAFMELRLSAAADAESPAYRQAVEFAAGLESDARYRCQFVLLGEVFRLGLDPAPAVAAMDIPAVDYIFARLEAETGGPRRLWEYLLAWQAEAEAGDGAEAGAGAGTMERYLALRVSEVLFVKNRASAQLDTAVLETYLERRRQWESALYAPGLLAGGGDPRLPSSLRAVCQAGEALRLWRTEGDYVGALRALKAAAVLDDVFRETAETLARRVTADYERAQAESERAAAAAGRAEFAALLDSVKTEAAALIARGAAAEAALILSQLEALAPGDAEIQALRRALAADGG
ncbi:MAG: glycosyltransferase [Gracilibacteraceae bacterium]|jgi:glycosyltransferase involved in cell wall biosynthesis|nr:glycosyltransferase [Gracilibacteraceae bacterium]